MDRRDWVTLAVVIGLSIGLSAVVGYLLSDGLTTEPPTHTVALVVGPVFWLLLAGWWYVRRRTK